MTVVFNTAALRARLQKAAMRGVVAATEAVRAEAIRLVQNPPKTGKIYRRRGVKHQASAPGQPPASDTGFLVSSITTEYDEKKLSGTVVVRAPYGPYLEYGTQKMEPRPFLRPAFESLKKNTARRIREEIALEFKP